MRVYRLATSKYVNDHNGTGAKLFGGRWNPKGLPCLYTSEYVSLALLERFVHAQGTDDMRDLMLLEINIEASAIYHTDTDQLKPDWQSDFAYSQWLGQQILGTPEIAAFSVPSAIVPYERNVVINPLSKAITSVVFSKAIPFGADLRLVAQLAKH